MSVRVEDGGGMKNYKRLPCPVFAVLTMAFLLFLFPLAAERPSDVPMLWL